MIAAIIITFELIWFAGWVIWLVHLHRKFKVHREKVSNALDDCKANRDDNKRWNVAMAEATLQRTAMELAHQDTTKCLIWPLLVYRRRWHVDYFEEAEKNHEKFWQTEKLIVKI